ncbi:hypothetical protein Pint_09175 [Pistacia integerrima]|uniref:Uncharacterized protein n=1 Tax=Pistacia integerrima TaxID=434235 RepID=A0ACC0XXI2_9ROSI|nr:hypothetical protein Pint_09175 [Pistacia integerrima]
MGSYIVHAHQRSLLSESLRMVEKDNGRCGLHFLYPIVSKTFMCLLVLRESREQS